MRNFVPKNPGRLKVIAFNANVRPEISRSAVLDIVIGFHRGLVVNLPARGRIDSVVSSPTFPYVHVDPRDEPGLYAASESNKTCAVVW